MTDKKSISEIPPDVIRIFSSYPSAPAVFKPDEIKIKKLGGGLINNSYRIDTPYSPAFFLQKINKSVFTDPDAIQKNYLQIWQYAGTGAGFRLPAPLFYGKDQTLFVDEDQDYWRAFEYMEHTKMYDKAVTPEQAGGTAKIFARFTRALDGFPPEQLQEVIPGFHDLGLRVQQFETAVKSAQEERLVKASALLIELKKRKAYKDFFEMITRSDQFVKRVMHHDAKIANVLFDDNTGDVVCPVDLDTVMPGYFFSDLGDMIRSMAGNATETSTAFEMIDIRKDFYDAILAGYLSGMGDQLTPAEKDNIHNSGLIMIYMQALRFITDYLNGDIYYQTSYKEQNYDRAYNQLALLKKLEDFLAEEYHFRIN